MFIASTAGDNTNLVIAQIAQRRFSVEKVIVRVMDPALGGTGTAPRGCARSRPTKQAIEEFELALGPEAALAYVRDHRRCRQGGEEPRQRVDQQGSRGDHDRVLAGPATWRTRREFEHAVQYGDATELWVPERAGIQRADLVIAVTGDDEDNILVCQVAKEKYLCDRIIARVNNPRNHDHFRLLGIQPAVSATDLILRLIEHEVPRYGLVHLLALEEERLEIIELEVTADAPDVGEKWSTSPCPRAA